MTDLPPGMGERSAGRYMLRSDGSQSLNRTLPTSCTAFLHYRVANQKQSSDLKLGQLSDQSCLAMCFVQDQSQGLIGSGSWEAIRGIASWRQLSSSPFVFPKE